MAYTVQAAFDSFHDAINLSGDHRAIANTRRDRLVSLLSNNFEIMDSFSSGSIPKFTALRGQADLDIIVALHYGKHIKDKSPTQVLQSVRDALGKYRTNVRKNGQAVTLHYNTWPSVDVVPVSRSVDGNKKVTHYNVPNANTGMWIRSNPKTHAANIESKASECGVNFRRIIKMIKWWNLRHGGYLQSYHIEVLALKVFSGQLDDITWCVWLFFKEAGALLTGPLWYDWGYADANLTPTDRGEAIKRFATAEKVAVSAWHRTYGASKDHSKAIALWRQLFGDKFPAYG